MSAKEAAVAIHSAMTFDDRGEIGCENNPELRATRQLRLSDLLRGEPMAPIGEFMSQAKRDAESRRLAKRRR